MNGKHAAQFRLLLACTLLVVSFFASIVNFSVEASSDDWIVYTPLHIINPLASSTTPQGYSPNQIRTAYNLPSSGGAGTTIAVIIAYHCPTIWNDLTMFSKQFNLPLPTNSNFIVHQMGTLTNSQWAKEAALDVEWAHAIAPNATILWDSSSLDIATVDATGSFSATVQVPVTTAGQHQLTILDLDSAFSVNLTRLPKVTDNYTDAWLTEDIIINLTPDYTMVDTYYEINNGATFSVSSNGQPFITTEGNNNTLEYWSAWNISGSGNMNLTHVTLNGIKLDKTPPSGTVTTIATTDTPSITLTLSATDDISGVAQMCFSNDGASWSSWEPYATSKNWVLTGVDGQKIVTVKFLDNAGLTSTTSCTVTLLAIQPSSTATATQSPTVAPTQVPTTAPPAAPTNQPTQNPTTSPEATPEIPELQIGIVLTVFVALTIILLAIVNRRN